MSSFSTFEPDYFLGQGHSLVASRIGPIGPRRENSVGVIHRNAE